MCIEDLAIARRTNLVRHDVASGGVLTLGQDPYRLAVRVSLPADVGGRAGITQLMNDIGLNKFIKLVDFKTTDPTEQWGQYDLSLNYRDDPGVIWGPLSFYVQSGAYCVLETKITEDLAEELRQYLKEKRSRYSG
jgi:hypothetical protein